MEAAMRLRSPAPIFVSVVSMLAGSYCAPAAAQIEFAKSSIRIVPASETSEATPHQPPAMKFGPRPTPGPRPLASSVRAAEYTTADDDLPPEPVSQTAPAKNYPVQQADFVAPPPQRPLIHAPIPARAPSMVSVYSSAAAQNTLNKMPRPAPIQIRNATTAPPKLTRGKPFQSVQSEPVISPYMNLYRTDTDANSLPNYLTMVRPQFEQQQASRQQTAEIQKLRAQLQSSSGGASGTPSAASMTAHAHYMDTAQFYRGTRR
jgi:hypothetical protein